jgi:hypothetical protein
MLAQIPTGRNSQIYILVSTHCIASRRGDSCSYSLVKAWLLQLENTGVSLRSIRQIQSGESLELYRTLIAVFAQITDVVLLINTGVILRPGCGSSSQKGSPFRRGKGKAILLV